jgi:hypothetical protein
LNEEPDREKPFVRFCEGLRHNRCMAEIGWHRRETRRQTENTNIMPGALEGLSLLDKNSCGRALIVFQEPPKPFTALYRAFALCLLAACRKEQDIPLPLMIALVMIVLHVLIKRVAERRFPKEDHP